LAPLLAGFLLSNFGVRAVFLAAGVASLIGFVLVGAYKLKDTKGKKRPDRYFVKNFKDFFRSKERVTAYVLGGGVNLWWTLIYLFVPLMILNAGLDSKWIAYFLFGVAVPLISLEYIFSNFVSERGFKKIMRMGYLLPAVLSVLCFVFFDIYVVMGLLMIASIGLAMLEPTTEAYFFDILKGKEIYRFYGPYNTAVDIGGLIGRASSAVVVFFLPMKFLFLLFAGFMFFLFLVTFSVKGIVESKRRRD
jgi:MFS family permease